MFIKKTSGYIVSPFVSASTKGALDIFIPKTTVSNQWKHWKAQIDPKTCLTCFTRHGKVYHVSEYIPDEPPLHPVCRCVIEMMDAIAPGDATRDGESGADYHLRYYGKLPDYYLSRSELIALGWKSSKPPAKYAPGKMLFGGIYYNDEGKLPSAAGRIWYEADINYYSGKRNGHRIVFSNDGLIFVTYNDGFTYYEVT